MRNLITSIMIVLIGSTSAFANPHENNWVHGFHTFETTDGVVYADRDTNGTWIKIDGQTGEYLDDVEITDEELVATMDGRVVLANDYYADSTIYVGAEIEAAAIEAAAAYDAWRANISDWDFFWGTTLNPTNTGWDYFWGTTMNPTLNGWNDFWFQCQDPNKTAGDCVGTVAAGIGFAVGVGIAAYFATVAASVAIASAFPMSISAIPPGVATGTFWLAPAAM